MPAREWLLGALLVAFAVQTAMTYRLYRRQRASDGSAAASSNGVDSDAGTVECPNCGSENELGYRYCRSCVDELPASTGVGTAPRDPLRQAT